MSFAVLYKESNLYTIIWIPQVRPSDLDRYKLPAQCRLQLTEHDRKMGEELLQEAFVQRHPEWVKELQIMLKSGEKAEIQVQTSAKWNSYPTLCRGFLSWSAPPI
jgi:DNA topoisomerase VI subunit A